MPVKALNTFVSSYTICVKVLSKTTRTWNKPTGSGNLLNVDLMDDCGVQIQATFFKDMADKYNEYLVEGEIYEMSGGDIKMANKKFTTIPHNFCIIFNDGCKIEKV